MKKTQIYKTHKSITELTEPLCAWIEQELNFPTPEQSTRGEAVVFRTRLSGLLRQASGLVFELNIELSPTGDGFVAAVDNGDIRKQLAALGIAWFFFWPLLVTAGYAHFANNAIVDQVLDKLRELSATDCVPPSERLDTVAGAEPLSSSCN